MYMHLVHRPYVLRWNKEYPEPFEYLGFCTWNTFYRDQSEEHLRTLAEKNFTEESGSNRFKYMIVDDGWQSTNEYPLETPADLKQKFQGPNYLQNIEANFKFPNGIKPISDLLKEQYGFRWFGVWHAINGYWNGIDPNFPTGQTYAWQKNGIFVTPDPMNYKAYNFWVDYYKYMRQQGVDLVKIDNQSGVGQFFKGIYPLDEAIEKYYLMQQGASYGQTSPF